MKSKLIFIIIFLLTNIQAVQAARKSKKMNAARASVSSGKKNSVVDLNYEVQKKDSFIQAQALVKDNKNEDAIKLLSQIEEKDLFYPYALMMKARILVKQQKESAAIEIYEKIIKLKSNQKLKQDAQFELGKIYFDIKKYEQSVPHLVDAEKLMRGQPERVQVSWLLAQAYSQVGRNETKCGQLKKIYQDHPDFADIASWGPELDQNLFQKQKTKCNWDLDNLKGRVRALIWSGQDKQALAEINLVAEKKLYPELGMDQIRAVYYSQVGEPVKAYEILNKQYEANRSSFDFLQFYAPVAARAGLIEGAIQAYYLAYQLQPATKLGQQALYQSAFMSYQFRNYDLAQQKFERFLKLAKNDVLRKDTQWHLAWIQYLKGNYLESTKEFLALNKASKTISDRNLYWLAMSLMKEGRTPESQRVFQKIANDPSYSYYSLAAKDRLVDLKKNQIPNLIARFSQPLVAAPVGRLPSEFLTPLFEDGKLFSHISEESLVLDQFLKEQIQEDPESQESVVSVDVPSENRSEEATEAAPDVVIVNDFGNRSLENQLVLAQTLSQMGYSDWSKWVFYELEKKLKRPEHLLRLIEEYEKVELPHRSSYVAQVRLGFLRYSEGLTKGKKVWQSTYPEAYASQVQKYSKEFSVPKELVWSIMRAETQYRKDAVSPVGALGLMQVMPYTGYKLANILKDSDFNPVQLLNPDVSVRYGSAYLRRLSQNFNGVLPLVAAAYNAGPHRASSWLKSFGTLDADEFIEHIPFLETRNYVKKVTSNNKIYSMLYKNGLAFKLNLSQRLPATIPEKVMLSEDWN